MPIRRVFVYVLLIAIVGLWRPPSLSGKQSDQSPIYFPGQLLVASPKIRDPRFRHSVIYMAKHDATGAHGIIINKIIGKQHMAKLLSKFGLDPQGATGNMNVHYGGPVNPLGAFMLYSSGHEDAGTRSPKSVISFSIDIKILRAVAEGKGPKNFLLALGYAGWSPGQLGDEVARGDWSLSQATHDLVFGDKREDMWKSLLGASQVPL